MKSNFKKILIIGGPNVGKTHFIGQLYGRLKSGSSSLKLGRTPDDLSILDDILKKLNNGIPGEHTPIGQNKNLILPITNASYQNWDLIYPDYGGELILNIVKNRKIESLWKSQIEDSNHWLLFIRLSIIEKIEDITTRFHASIVNDNFQVPEDIEYNCNSDAFYIELLQMFLFTKGISKAFKKKPKLTILLSCWDEIEDKNKKPKEIFKTKMPLFYDFVKSLWNKNFDIIALSAIGKALNKEKPDQDYKINGPEKFGYIITNDGNKTNDITLALKNIIN